MVSHEMIFKGLNEKQIEAVRAIEGPVLILAGAGSGKTRALTHRIAHMIASGIRPENILAVTFTNKASDEIKNRVYDLLKADSRELKVATASPWLGTFHSICVRILRREIEQIGQGHTRGFAIYDEEDQLSLVKKVMQGLELDVKKFNPKMILGKISTLKSELIGHEEYSPQAKDYFEKILLQVYAEYQKSLQKNNALDFDDLIMLCVRLFREYPAVLEKYQNIFRYILIDEYQDTSHFQYVWTNLLAQQHRNLFVIGDDAQSIYAFRQADIRNILDFEKDYPEAKIIMLEQNYRSTKTILAAANNIILNNRNQKRKKLWTENLGGSKINLSELGDERREGRYVVEKINEGIRQGRTLNDFTILYRTHAQSRAIEEALVKHGFPYRIIGGVKFYQRREVKDILAYLRLALNPRDEVSLERIYNVPPRGIGAVSFERFKLYFAPSVFRSVFRSSTPKPSVINVTNTNLRAPNLGVELLNKSRMGDGDVKFQDFAKLLLEIHQKSAELPPAVLAKYIIQKTGYEYYINDKTEEGKERWENVRELLSVARKYDSADTPSGLANFLEEVALVQETDRFNRGDKVINLMTVHSAKGLEFPVVFIVGMEDGLFPISRALFEPHELEEERRLCYVAVTRAKEELHLTYCRQRMLYGSPQFNSPSRFIFEIPEQLLDFKPLSKELEENHGRFSYGRRRKPKIFDWEEFIDYN